MLSVRSVFFMIDHHCLLSQVHGCSRTRLYIPHEAHRQVKRWERGVSWKESPLPWPRFPFFWVLQDNFSWVKRRCHSKWHCLKKLGPTKMSTVLPKRWYSTQIHVGPQRPHRWQMMSKVHNSLMKYDVSVVCMSRILWHKWHKLHLENFDGNCAYNYGVSRHWGCPDKVKSWH